MFREIGDGTGEAEALNALGEALLAVGRAADATEEYATALAVATATGDRHERERAQKGLAAARRPVR